MHLLRRWGVGRPLLGRLTADYASHANLNLGALGGHVAIIGQHLFWTSGLSLRLLPHQRLITLDPHYSCWCDIQLLQWRGELLMQKRYMENLELLKQAPLQSYLLNA